MNTCEQCGSIIVGRRKGARYCTRSCNDAALYAARPGWRPALTACAWCSGEFVAYKSTHRFCSRKCREKGCYRDRAGYPAPVPCNWCGKTFTPPTHKASIYCSPLCRSKAPILTTYNTTGARLFKMLADQNGLCATGCGTELSLLVARGHPMSAHVDHDHKCCNDGYRTCGQCVRGLMCPQCNLTLGWLEAKTNQISPLDRCLAVAAYLLRDTNALSMEAVCASR